MSTDVTPGEDITPPADEPAYSAEPAPEAAAGSMVDDPAKADTSDPRRQKVEIFLAIMLGLAAILAAFGGYKASLEDGKTLDSFNEGIRKSDAANQQYLQGNQIVVADQALFLEYAKAAQEDNTELVAYLRDSLMSDQLVKGIEWWEQQPDTDDGPGTPFVEENPDYAIEEFAAGEQLDKESEGLFTKARTADDRGDKFTRGTVIVAVGLFMLGIAGLLGSLRIAFGMGLAGTALTAYAAAVILTV